MMKNMKFFRYLTYILEIILLFILGTTPNVMPEFFGSTPCLLLSLSMAIAVFEAEVPAMIFGLLCGLMTDIGFSNSIGIFTVFMTIVCFALGFCAIGNLASKYLKEYIGKINRSKYRMILYTEIFLLCMVLPIIYCL